MRCIKSILPILILVVFMIGCGENKLDTAAEYIESGHFQQARELIDYELQENPKNARAHYLRGMLALQDQEGESGVKEHFTAAVLKDGKYREKIFDLMMTYVDTLINKKMYHKIGSAVEFGLQYDQDKRKKAGEIIFEKIKATVEVNPIEYGDLARQIYIAKNIDNNLSNEIGEFCFETASRLWDSKLVDVNDMSNVDLYLQLAMNQGDKWKGKSAELLLSMASPSLNNMQDNSAAVSLLDRAYNLDIGQAEKIGELCIEASKSYLESKDYTMTAKMASLGERYYPKVSDEARKICAQIPYLYFADFENGNLQDWYPTERLTAIDNGQLVVAPSRGNYVWLKQEFKVQNLMLEFDAKAKHDVHIAFCSPQMGRGSMYEIVIGGWSNKRTVLRKYSQSREVASSKVVNTPDELEHIIVRRNNDIIELYVNGIKAFSYKDDSPIRGGYIGFATWDKAIYFDNVKVAVSSGEPIS